MRDAAIPGRARFPGRDGSVFRCVQEYDKLLFEIVRLKKRCHCEPVRTLAWQSPG